MPNKITCLQKLLWLSFLCMGLVGCASVRRDTHVFCASSFGFVGAYGPAHRQMEDAFKIDLAHLPAKVARDCDTLVWYEANFHVKDKDEVLPHCEQALALCRKVNDRDGQAWCLNLMGRQYSWTTNLDNAIQCFGQAQKISHEIKRPTREANSFAALGDIYNFLSQYGKAIDHYEKALALYRTANDKMGQSVMLNALGSQYYQIGQLDKALDYFNKALALQPIFGPTRFFPAVKFPEWDLTAVCYDNLGQTHSSLKQHKKAIHDYKRAMLLHTIFRSGWGVDWCYNRLGWEYESLGEHHKALLAYELERAGRSRGARRSCDGSTFRNMGYTYAQLDKYDKALRCFEQSLSILREVKDRPLEANTLDTLMGFWKDRGKGTVCFVAHEVQAIPTITIKPSASLARRTLFVVFLALALAGRGRKSLLMSTV